MQLNKNIFLFFVAIFFFLLAIIINKLNTKVIDLTENEKCPACFGTSLCSDIKNEKITLEFNSFNSIFNNLIGIKNVFFGNYNNVAVVMKKLASNSELKVFDKIVCSNNILKELCHTELNANNAKTDFHQLILSDLKNFGTNDASVKLRFCPTAEKIDEILAYAQKENFSDPNYYKFIWSSIKINPEPLILQLLKAEDGWPTPKYYGACGRLIVQEFIIFPLLEYYEESWIKRAKIASSLLDAAHKFTFKNKKFSIYLTDISIDNIAVNENHEAIFVDLENVIIVDKYPSTSVLKKIINWNDTYKHEIETDCEDCFVFSPRDICQHKISDHNYYAICQHILMQNQISAGQIEGFLHDPPSKIIKKYPQLISLLSLCSKPTSNFSRIKSGIQLKEVLDEIIKNTK